MRARSRTLFKDRRGISSTATAALFSIIAILIFMAYMNIPGKTMEIALAFYEFFKDVKVLPPNFDPREFLDSPTGQIAAYFTSMICMVLVVVVIFNCIKWPMEIVSTILVWRRTRREKQQKIVEETKNERKLRRKELKRDKQRLTILHGQTRESKGRGSEALNSIAKNIDKYKLLTKQWWEIGKTLTLTLEDGKLRELILEARKLFPTKQSPQGSYIELAKAIGYDAGNLRKTVEEGRNSMTVEKLLRILDIMKMPYDTLTPYIKAVGATGHKEAIVNPKFPISMNNPDGARLVAAALMDGHIDKNKYCFVYTNYNPENRQLVTEAVQHVFGEVDPSPIYDKDGRQRGIRFYSSVIADMLLGAGAVAGRKVEQDYNIPYMVSHGDYAIRNEYFKQAIRDDGSMDYQRYEITIIGARELESKVIPEHRRVIEHLDIEKKPLPSGVIESYIVLKDGLDDDLPDELKPAYYDLQSKMWDEWVPTILKEEKETLEKTYGVEAELIPKEIYLTEKRGLRGKWHIEIRGKENFEKMVRQLDWNDLEKGGNEKL